MASRTYEHLEWICGFQILEGYEHLTSEVITPTVETVDWYAGGLHVIKISADAEFL